jgi:hypothetical protein
VALARTHLYNPYFTQQAAAYYGYQPMKWPNQYMSAKFAAFRQFERERADVAELRALARPGGPGRDAAQFGRTNEWEMKGAAVGAAAASAPKREE